MTNNINIHFSIIIIGKKKSDCAKAINALKKLEFQNFEVLIATGNNPSIQRNKAAEKASGEYLLFLDNDSEVEINLLQIYAETIHSHQYPDIIGGPAIFKSSDSYFANSVKIFTSSALGMATSKARYTPIGEIRASNEQELILCNMCIKKDFFILHKGLNPTLYPTEENEFIDRTKGRSKIIYHPLAIIRRESVYHHLEFINKFYNYGKGRAKYFQKDLRKIKIIYLVPSFFTLYLISLVFERNLILFTPVIVYLILAATTSLFNCLYKPKRSSLLTTLIFFLGHISYGVGFIIQFAILSKAARNVSCEVELFSTTSSHEDRQIHCN